MPPDIEEQIITAWHKNAKPWSSAVRNNDIASRSQVTNNAILNTVISLNPTSVIDIGCGEGWLIRALAANVERLLGVDAVEALIALARQAGGGDFLAVDYDSITQGGITEKFDVAVCNFSLLGYDSVNRLIRSIPSLLNANGHLVIQTLHPKESSHSQPYVDGWRDGSWHGFGSDFTDPAPWYFRTMETWQELLNDSGFELCNMLEPSYPESGFKASVIFIAKQE